MREITRLSLPRDVLPAIIKADLLSVPERLVRRGDGIGLVMPRSVAAANRLIAALQKLGRKAPASSSLQIVAIGDPGLLRHLMLLDETSHSSTDRRGEIYDHLKQRGPHGEPGDVLDGGSFTQDRSELWERTRRAARMTNTREIAQSILQRFHELLEDRRGAKNIDLLTLLKKAFIYGLSLRLFGTNMQEVGQARLAAYAPEYFERMAWQLLFALLPGKHGLGRKKYAQTGKALGSVLDEMIDAIIENSTDFEGSLLAQLLDEFDVHDPVERQLIKGSLGTEVMAAFDSVGVVVAQACRHLARNSTIQTELRDEGKAVSQGGNITPGMWRVLRKTKKFWKLSLHKSPAFRVIFRHVAREFSLVVKREGFTITHKVRPGDQLLLVLSAAHHDPAYWAEENMTLQHTLEGWTNREEFAHLPYGVGKRECMGKSLAEMVGPLLIATLLQQCVIKLPRLRIPGVAMAMTSPLRSTIFNVTWL